MAEREVFLFKPLVLVTPEYAQEMGLDVEVPILTSLNDSDAFIYQAGEVITVPRLDPLTLIIKRELGGGLTTGSSVTQEGIGYWEIPKGAVFGDFLECGPVKNANWIAIVEPLGEVLRHSKGPLEFNRITNSLSVKEIVVQCDRGFYCKSGLIQEGLVLDFKNGFLFASCTTEPWVKKTSRRDYPFRFQIGPDGKINFTGIEEWEVQRRTN